MAKVGVLGTGTWGMALARVLADPAAEILCRIREDAELEPQQRAVAYDAFYRAFLSETGGEGKWLNELLEKGKKTKKIPSKLLIDTLDSMDADEQMTDRMYDALEAAGVEIDVDDVLEIIGKADALEPSAEELQQQTEKSE